MIVKSLQFSIFCENYGEKCNEFIDFASYDTFQKAVTYFKAEGWKRIKTIWYCKNCAANMYKAKKS